MATDEAPQDFPPSEPGPRHSATEANIDSVLDALGRHFEALFGGEPIDMTTAASQPAVVGRLLAHWQGQEAAIQIERLAATLVSALPLAAAIVTSDGRCRIRNARFAEALRGFEPLFDDDVVTFRQPGLQLRWLAALDQAIVARQPGHLWIASPEGDTLTLQLLPLTPLPTDSDLAQVLVMIDPPSPRAMSEVTAFALRHGLTATETAVLRALCDGQSLQDIARLHGSSRSTVKTHLARIFRKSGRHSQRELIVAALAPAGDEGNQER